MLLNFICKINIIKIYNNDKTYRNSILIRFTLYKNLKSPYKYFKQNQGYDIKWMTFIIKTYGNTTFGKFAITVNNRYGGIIYIIV